MKWSEIRLLYAHEMRSALREPNIVLQAVLLPIILYPVMLWGVFTAMSFAMGQKQAMVSRVVLRNLPAEQGALREKLRDDKHIELVDSVGGLPPGTRAGVSPEDSAWENDVHDGRLDLLVDFEPPAANAAALPGNFSVRLAYDASKDRSVTARQRVGKVLDEYRSQLLQKTAASHGIPPTSWEQFRIAGRDVATGHESGAFLLGIMLPMPLVLMVAVGCFSPAVDTTAGERERNTWETTMTLAVSRTSIVMAKYLHVATIGCVAGLLNVVAMFVTVVSILQGLIEQAHVDIRFAFPLAALPVFALGAILLALFFAAMLMVMAAFARNFKEGQSMTMPFYLLVTLPTVLLASPNVRLTPTIACIPVANLVLTFREALGGVYHPGLMAVTMATSLLAVAGALCLARFILAFEDVMVGSYSGSLLQLLRDRLLKRRRGAAQ